MESNPDNNTEELSAWCCKFTHWKGRAFLHHNPDLIPLFSQKLGQQHPWIPGPASASHPAAGSDHQIPGSWVPKSPVPQGTLPPDSASHPAAGSVVKMEDLRNLARAGRAQRDGIERHPNHFSAAGPDEAHGGVGIPGASASANMESAVPCGKYAAAPCGQRRVAVGGRHLELAAYGGCGLFGDPERTVHLPGLGFPGGASLWGPFSGPPVSGGFGLPRSVSAA